jgi:hypothetical protein
MRETVVILGGGVGGLSPKTSEVIRRVVDDLKAQRTSEESESDCAIDH